MAVPFHRYTSSTAIVESLLSYGADINLTDSSNSHYTALHLAAKNDDELVEFLLRNGADPTIEDGNTKSPLHYAVDSKVMWVLSKHSWYEVKKGNHINQQTAWSYICS